MHHTIIYSIILIVILFIIIYINNTFYLEGYTMLPNLSFTNSNPQNTIVSLNNNSSLQTTCELSCDNYDDLYPQNGCVGFSSNIANGTGKSGTCTFYNNESKLSFENIDQVKYNTNSNLYIK